MKKRTRIKILAIESSCDETSASIIEAENPKSEIRNPNGRYTPYSLHPTILSNIVSSQIDLHAKTGGVVPEVASRAHMEAIIPVIERALSQANSKKQETRYKQDFNDQFSISNESSNQKNLEPKTHDLEPDLLKQVTHIAVTAGPGLIGSLLVGFNTAKALAYSLNIPIIPVNHIEGHIYSALAQNKANNEKLKTKNNVIASNAKQSDGPDNYKLTAESFPLLALTVSGGHTSLTLMKDHGSYENIGITLDDAAGEAFDKVAKLLDLGYPGGPVVSKLAQEFRNRIMKQELRSTNNHNSKFEIHNSELVFPRPIINDGTFNFSFSGLKTAVLTYVKKLTANGESLSNDKKAEICCAFEDAVVDVLVTKTLRAAEKYQPKVVILAGGVAANKHLREELSIRITSYCHSRPACLPVGIDRESNIVDPRVKPEDDRKRVPQNDIKLLVPPITLCGDNAAMIGVAAYYHILKNDIKTWNEISVDSNLKL